MDEIEVTRNGQTNQFSITLVRGGDTIRCMVSVALGGSDERSDGEKHRAALSKARLSRRRSIQRLRPRDASWHLLRVNDVTGL